MISIKQKRSFLKKIFGNQQKIQQPLTTAQMLNTYNSRIYNYDGSLYDNAVIRSCVDTIARYFSKMQMVHRLKGKTVEDTLNTLLTLRPNPYQSAHDFLYQVATLYEMDNNAYIYIQRDLIGNVIALYPFSYAQAELKESKNGDMFLEFAFRTGKKITAPIDDVIILRKHQYENDFFGESNRRPLYPLVNLLHVISEGIINACKSSAFIRGILKITGMIQPEDLKKKRDLFKDEFLSTQNDGGAIVTDSQTDYTPIESKPTLIDDKQTALVNQSVFSYFGLNSKIINGTYSEEEFQAFYEGVLEPLAIQLAQELTAKLFSSRQIGFGNEIVLVGDKLSYMSMRSKVQMINAVKDLGVITGNQIADILNIERPPDGDKILQSLNYIDKAIANQYQLNAAKNGAKKGDDTENEEENNSEGNQDESDPDQSGGTDGK